ncbi:ECF RNA polymerase sigma factor RpoE [Methyloligella halotolerans]|uniref:RNA polymerase sigma factor n=1 Tax=Methyloligella halotolerans TaxID=1177755 RepID=A0A1E2RX60_9HYPH|nr:sigma-70 family RNA polymerase sigma factor [Methyloligella halotolerans]ODA66705.1 ECF RNA polymerase sigma factor RpoE [Methyloligella halotolerans]
MRQLREYGAQMRGEGEATAEPDPEKLITAIARRKDREAFVSLFEAYASRIKGFLMRGGTSEELAEDIAQETLLMVWRKAETYRPEKAGASTWIFTIARNLRIDRSRRDARRRTHLLHEAPEPEGPDRPDELLQGAQNEDRVREALKTLPADQLRVLQLSFFEGRSHSEIAEMLEIPLGTVKSRVRLAMGRLREALGEGI